MQEVFAPDAGRPTVASCKVPADIIEAIDQRARVALLPRSTWIRNAILEKLHRDGVKITARDEAAALDAAQMIG